MRSATLIGAWLLAGCLTRPLFDPVGGFELVHASQSSGWSEESPRAFEGWLAEARRGLATLPVYTAVLETRERIEDELFPRRLLALKLRQEPFGVAVETLEPESERGQRVWFDERKNDGELLAETPGFLGGLVGRVSLDPRSDLALRNRRHALTDIGLARLLAQVEAGFVPTLSMPVLPRIRAMEIELEGRAVRLVEALVPREVPDASLLHRFGFDREHALLTYYGLAELLPDGPALIEEYRYRDLVAAPELGDEDFMPE
jgi:hypothetical protein